MFELLVDSDFMRLDERLRGNGTKNIRSTRTKTGIKIYFVFASFNILASRCAVLFISVQFKWHQIY